MSGWQCSSCGFMNRDANSICGGTGTMGCKLPRDVASSGGFGKSGGKGKGGRSSFSPYGAGELESALFGGEPPGLNSSKSFDNDRWQCLTCNFVNKGSNDVCGGFGSMGCKAPRAASAGPAPSGSNEKWRCLCGFMNNAQNSVCGGVTGPLGCKTPRAVAMLAPTTPDIFDNSTYAPPRPTPQHTSNPVRFGGAPQKVVRWDACSDGILPDTPWTPPAPKKSSVTDVPWTCFCGFRNRGENEICGGPTGRLGCKTPKDAAEFGGISDNPSNMFDFMKLAMNIYNRHGGSTWPSAGKGRKAAGKGSGDWICVCGFKNRGFNTVCGGKGDMGCNLLRIEGDTGGATAGA